jgi:hypothetical protein
LPAISAACGAAANNRDASTGLDIVAESEEILVCGRLREPTDRVRRAAELRRRPMRAAQNEAAARFARRPA